MPVQQLTEPHVLRQLVQRNLEAISFSGTANEVENVGPLDGGYALLEAGQLVIEPRCCGDLGDLDSWRDAALRRAERHFWIGHPTIQATMKGVQLALREEERSGGLPLREWRVSTEALAQAIPRAAREQEAFSLRLEPILAEFLESSLVRLIAQRLSGLEPG